MSWVAVAIAGSAIVGGAVQSNAANKAAGAQTDAAGNAIGASESANAQARRDLAPYSITGSSAVSRIGQLLGLPSYATVDQNDPRYQQILNRIVQEQDAAHRAQYGMSIMDQRSGLSAPGERARFDDANRQAATSEYLKQQGGGGGGQTVADIMAMDPGYQFRLNEGNKALTNSLSAMGLRNSGAALKAGTRYAQDYASGEFGNIYNRLANTAGMGQGAVNAGVQSGANTAGTVGNYLTGAANARGAAAIGSANAYGNAMGTVGNYYGQQATLDKIINRPPAYTGYGGGSPY